MSPASSDKHLRITAESRFRESPKWTSIKNAPAIKDTRADSFPVPAPGHYDVKDGSHKFCKRPIPHMSKEQRGGYQMKYQIPPPGQYEPKIQAVSAPSFGFGSSTRDPPKHKFEVPGPGTYDEPRRPTGLSTTLNTNVGRKLLKSRSLPEPGPGQYNASFRLVHAAPPAYKDMGGTGRRTEFRDKSTPETLGPGTYKHAEIGVGKSILAPSSPTFSFQGRRREQVASATPAASATWSSFGS